MEYQNFTFKDWLSHIPESYVTAEIKGAAGIGWCDECESRCAEPLVIAWREGVLPGDYKGRAA